MDFDQAWGTLQWFLNKGTQAAMGAGMIDRHEVERINNAERAIAEHINTLTKANQQLADLLNAQGKKQPCDCEDKAAPDAVATDAAAMEAAIAEAEAEVKKTMGE